MPMLFPRGRAGWSRFVTRLAVIALLLIGGWFVLLSLAERSLLYPCRYRPAPAMLATSDRVRLLEVEHEDGVTHGYLFLGDGISAQSPGPVVLYSKGNGELAEDYADGLPGYRRMGVSTLILEYRGCGNADGKPTKRGIDADHVAFYDLAAGQPEVDAARIVFHGRSMGGGILASLATQREPAALVLESTYSSIKDYAKRLLVPGFLVKDNFDVAATLRDFAGPVFMVHSERDEVIPYRMSEINRRAYAAGNGQMVEKTGLTFVTYDLGHNDPMPDAFYVAVEAFFHDAGVLDERP